MALLGSSSLWEPHCRAAQIATSQEQPDHPLPRVWRSLPPAVAVIATVITAQELPDHPRAWAQVSTPPHPAVIQTVTTQQEQPDQPRSQTQPSVIATVVATTFPLTRTITTQQEQPDRSQGLAATWPGVQFLQGAVIPTYQVDQEYPDLGRASTFYYQVIPNVAALPQVNQYARTTQETPDHPVGWSRIGTPPTAATITVPPVNRTVNATRQDDIDWAFVALEMAIPGPNQAPPYNLQTSTTQEAPDHPPSLTWAKTGIPPSTAVITVPPGTRSAYTVQEQQIVGYANVWPGVQFPQGAVIPTYLVDQEYPDTPHSWAAIGAPPVFVSVFVPPGTRQSYTQQEQPDSNTGTAFSHAPVFTPVIIVGTPVYNTMLLSIPGGMASIPGDPPS